jgi:hypothetical protein
VARAAFKNLSNGRLPGVDDGKETPGRCVYSAAGGKFVVGERSVWRFSEK